MPNPWITFVKEWIKENDMPYSQAIKDPRVQEAYKRGKTQTIARNVAQGKLSDIASKAKVLPPKAQPQPRSAAQRVFDNPDLMKIINDAKPEESWKANYDKRQRLRMEEAYSKEMRLIKQSGLPRSFYNTYYQIYYSRNLATLAERLPKKINTLLGKLDSSIDKLNTLMPKDIDVDDNDFMESLTGIDSSSFTEDDIGIDDDRWTRDAPDTIRNLIDTANELYEEYRPKKSRPAPVRRSRKNTSESL
jgi:hypothetical protein